LRQFHTAACTRREQAGDFLIGQITTHRNPKSAKQQLLIDTIAALGRINPQVLDVDTGLPFGGRKLRKIQRKANRRVGSKDFMEAGKRRLAGDTARAANTDEVKDLRRGRPTHSGKERQLWDLSCEQTFAGSELQSYLPRVFRPVLWPSAPFVWAQRSKDERSKWIGCGVIRR